MKTENSSPAIATIWFTIGNFIAKGISFISLPLFTHIMLSSEYGLSALFLTYEQIFLILGTFEMYLGTYQRGLFKFKESDDVYSGFTVALMNGITTLAFFLLLLNGSILFKYTKITVVILVAMFFRTVFQPAYECWIVRRRIEYDYKPAFIANVILATFNLLIPLLAMYYYDCTAETRIVSGLVAVSVFTVFFWANEIKKIKRINIGLAQSFLKYNIRMSLPNVPHALSFLILANADRIMIGKLVGESAVAYYSVAYAVGSVLMIIQTSISSIFSPWMYKKIEMHKEKEISNACSKIALLLGIATFVFTLIVPDVFKLFFTKDYYDAIECIPPIALSAFFMFIYSAFVHFELFNEKPLYIMIVSVTCAFLNIAMNYCFIPIFGYKACCWTTLISYICFAMGHYTFANRLSAKNKTIFPFNIMELGIISLVLVILTCMNSVIYKHVVIRYFVVLVVLVIAYINRKRLFSIIKSVK